MSTEWIVRCVDHHVDGPMLVRTAGHGTDGTSPSLTMQPYPATFVGEGERAWCDFLAEHEFCHLALHR